MTDFLEQYGEQFRHAIATGRAFEGQNPAVRTRRRLRAGLIALVVAGVATPALAITQPWQPILGRPDIDDGAPTVSAAPIPPDQAKALSVLRRDQTSEDRNASSLLRSLHPGFDGVNPASIRLLHGGSAHPVALVPVDHVFQRHDREGLPLFDHALCLTEAEIVSCGSTQDVLTGRLIVMSGSRVYGLVPDAVVTVRATFADGQTVAGPVADNLFDITAPGAQSGKPADDPSQNASAGFRSLQWLAKDGSVVGGFDHP
jgi:hypothetical protein